MSGSPKYCSADLSENLESELAREREARATARREAAMKLEREASLREAAAAREMAAELERKAEAVAMVAGAQYDNLVQDATNAGMDVAILRGMREAQAAIHHSIEESRFREVIDGSDDIRKDLAQKAAAVDAWVERRSRRELVLAAIVDALPGLGFSVASVERGPLTRELCLVRAVLPRGAEIVVGVGSNPEGGAELYYESRGFAQEEHVRNNETVKSCDELEGLLDSLHADIRGSGVVAGPLEWEGKDGSPSRAVGQAGSVRKSAPRRRGGRNV